MVQFEDGSIKAQMGLPDMKLPIQYALAFPRRIKNGFPRCDFRKFNSLTFDEPDYRTFKNLTLAIEALNKGGNLPCVLNASNEIAVYAFLKNKIGFLEMTDIIEKTMEKVPFIKEPSLDELYASDGEARSYAADLIQL
jgi:1-deoxy-D-xylulose-5-phosphate reductoisomerase